MSNTIRPDGAGEAATRLHTHDWSGTALGPFATWPGILRNVAEIVVRSPVGMTLIWGEDGVLIYNDAYARIAGARHPAIFGAAVRDAWPEAWDFNRGVIAACAAGREQAFHGLHFVLDRDGQPRDAWFDMFCVPVMDEHGQMRGVLSTIFETTERVCAERERNRHEQRLVQANTDLDALRLTLERRNRQLAGDMDFLNALFRQAPSFMAVLTGPDHVFELVNDAYLRLIQHREVLGKPVRLALPEVVGQGFVGVLDRVYREGEAFHGQDLDVMLQTRDGSASQRRILDFVFQPLKDRAGNTYGIFIEGTDITEHALTEERLRVAQEAGQIGTFEWFPATGAVEVSEAYRRLWGFGPDAAITADLLVSRVEPADRPLLGPSRLGSESNPIGYAEFRIIRADTGERRWIARRGQPVASTTAGVQRYLGVAFDVTERKRIEDNLRAAERALRELNQSLERQVMLEESERFKAEEALRQAQKMEAVGQLASGVAHDFNNVLQIISSSLQLMTLDGVGGALAARLANAIAAVERGSKLSSQLLAFARRQPLQPVATHLGRLIADMRALLERALGDRIDVTLEQAPGLWNVEVDRNQLENAVLNMAINARDAMGGNGSLAIRLSNAAGDGPAAADQVCLSVTDSGCGMTPEVLAKIFEPFYTTKAQGKGTGLGMSMVYGFVKQSGGEVRIDSRPGAGTTIRIYLPRALREEAEDGLSDAPEAAGAGETILFVDDDPAVLATSVELLAGLGYRVLAASDGEQALALLGAGPVVLLLAGLSMPGRVDCAALVARCRAVAPRTRILLTSGQLPDTRIAGAADLLAKPYSRMQLARAVRTQLGAAAAPAPSLPAAAAEPPAPKADAGADTARRILVVEDDPDTRALACELLCALGHDASGSASAEDALARLRDHPVDVLFTDLNLPGMTGIELAARASAAWPALKVVLASGEGKSVVLPAGSGIVLLPKPYDLLDLEHSIAGAGPSPCAVAH
ncbi:response regulator [Massilia sp.]|uniref:hybrid sensor histidine kinase/response regulator n=1 Tax=Massilia sp. TaxID=1882437 RepID=UPI0028A78E07|nr:response regulator [Massilia sp.]